MELSQMLLNFEELKEVRSYGVKPNALKLLGGKELWS